MMNYDRDDEFRQRVLEVADYVIKNKASTRETAKYFKDNCWSISNVTVYNYLTKYLREIDRDKYLQVQEILVSNQPVTVDNENVKKRVYHAVSLLLKGYTVSEIANLLNSTVDIIYDDVTSRFKRLEQDDELIRQVNDALYEHKMSNLKKR